MPVTLKDVALRAGVSRSAVSRAFTPGASVSAKTRAKVERAARELGYAPSALASALSTGRTKLIGLVSNNFHNPVFLEVFDRFTRGLQERGLRPLLVNLSDETDAAQSVRMLRQYSVDAVIVASSTLPPDFALAYREAGLAVVHSFGRCEQHPVVPVVGIDNAACGRMAAQTLAARGYRRVAFLGGPESATSTQDRLAGFRDGWPGAPPPARFASAYSFAAGRAEMQRLLREGPPAEAYFCGDDVLSLGALSALRDAGYDVPGDVGVIGLNDMEMAGWAGFDLTTIRQPVGAIIAASIDLALMLAEDPAMQPETRLFPCTLIERATLRPLPAAAP
ncbi:LacI family DNA-binding transcriptional regulator [Aestuariicoccus sp. MJ-SS9]|uniref:LacI family DNA-binding transcriptional regulator n=1 Tax=Aestuariicoccus sp. MJ-SS9 TaxID=3079855 RepID=UPI002911B954|nr:LacI family DNA-binding transcriptional regulator [Aestuariicoccus sp. MJ-SS9]MDU8912027.1 LacI family DNA-binding transcriptional regulator [Aestuariicoccus sp. MJ-SS9]